MSDESRYLSVKECVKISGLSYTTLREKIRSGALKSSRPTWKYVVLSSDLEAFLSGGTKPAVE